MSATCLEPPVRTPAATGVQGPASRICPLAWALGITHGVGLLWRTFRYLAAFPIWGDEAYVLLNLLDRDYLGLAGYLDHAQVAPILFLWLMEAVLNTLGGSDLALRLVPFLVGVAAVFLFWSFCRRHLAPIPAALASGLLAVSYYPVRHGCEVKPYGLDLFLSLALAFAALEWLREPARRRWLVALLALTPVAVLTSYPAVFVAGALSLVLLPTVRRADRGTKGLYVALNLLLVGTFLGHYFLVARQQIDIEEARAVHAMMQDYWHDSFPPPQPWNWPAWFVRVHTGNLLAYPAGGNHGASTASFLLAVAGVMALWRQGQRRLLLACLLPFALTVVAAALRKYPYGGSARVAQHLAPFVCVLMGVGLGAILTRVCGARARFCAALWLMILSAVGVAGIVRDYRKPYKAEQDYQARRLADAVHTEAGPNDRLVLCNWEPDLLSNFVWYHRQDPRHRWLGRDPIDPGPGGRLWLLYYSEGLKSDAEVLNLLGAEKERWVQAAAERWYLPSNLPYPPYHVVKLGLQRR